MSSPIAVRKGAASEDGEGCYAGEDPLGKD